LSPPDFRDLVRHRLSGGAELDDDVIAELAAQLEDAYSAAIARGAPETDALREVEAEVLGDTAAWHQLDRYLQAQTPPRVRVAQSPGPLGAIDDAWRRCGRQMLRRLRHEVHFTTAVVLTLSLCLGVAAALLTVVNAVLLRPLPFPEPDRVVLMAVGAAVTGNVAGTSGIRSDVPSYFDRRQRLTVFEEMALFRWIDVVLETGGVAQRVRGDIGTPSLLRLIGVKPLHGRLLEDGDAEPGAERKIVLSHSLWQELFAGNPAAVGTAVALNGRQFTIVGVMPPDFAIFRLDARFWIPAVYSAEQRADDHRGWLDQYQLGRLRPGVSLQDARRELAAFDASEVARFSWLRFRERTGYRTTVERLRDVITRDVRPALRLLLFCSLLVLLLGLLNIATLTIARSRRYSGELATRRALGSGWRALAMPLLAQSAIISALGGAGALLLAGGLLSMLRRVGLQELPRAAGLGLEGSTVAVCAAAAMLAGAIIGLAPIAALAGVPLVDALRDGANERAPTPGGRRLRRGLVAVQVAAAFVLTVGMGWTVVSLGNALAEDPGFNAERVTTVSFDVPLAQYPDAGQTRHAVSGILESVHRIPGVEAAGVTQLLPFGGRTAALNVRPSSQLRGQERTAWNYVVSPGYFAAMQVPLLAGRYLDERDTAETESVIVIGRRLAQRLWPGGDPIGQQLLLPPLEATRPFTIVGVVGDVRQENLMVADEDQGGAMYRTYRQADERSFALAVRSRAGTLDESVLAGAVEAAGLVPYDARPMRDRVDASLTPQRLVSVNTGLFAVITLLLAAVGLYAALTYLVAERRRELGVRLVLGSSPRALAILVMSEGVLTATGGLAIGLVSLWWVRPMLEPSLYAVDSLDTPIVAAAAVLVVMVSLLASLGPARHASRVDPLLVIKS
jgi:predicted permease